MNDGIDSLREAVIKHTYYDFNNAVKKLDDKSKRDVAIYEMKKIISQVLSRYFKYMFYGGDELITELLLMVPTEYRHYL